MLKSHAKFHSEKGKRLLLVVDDEPVNRALLGAVLEGEYEILFAENGQQGWNSSISLRISYLWCCWTSSCR